jgi:hypothetical protein
MRRAPHPRRQREAGSGGACQQEAAEAAAEKLAARAQRKSAPGVVEHPATPDGRYFVRGRISAWHNNGSCRGTEACARHYISHRKFKRLGPVSTRLCHAASPVQTGRVARRPTCPRGEAPSRRSEIPSPGITRDELIRKARQCETGSHMSDCLARPD